MGCCFSTENATAEEREPILSNGSSVSPATVGRYNSEPVEPVRPSVAHNNNDNSDEFINVCETFPSEMSKELMEKKSDFYRDRLIKLGNKLPMNHSSLAWPNVPDPWSVLLQPVTPRHELEQIETSAKIMASLVEQMKPKVKEPLITNTLDW